MLFIVSFMPYIALPLSGFTLELTSGYSSAASTGSAHVVGQTKDTFLDQNLEEVFTRSFNRWSSPGPSVLYGRSAYYVPAENASALDRTWLQTYPNSWPDDPRTTVFIAPQSKDIVGGKGWGLESSLNCSVVSRTDQFDLLSQRNADNTAPRCPPINFNSSDAQPEYEGLPDLCDFDVYTLHQPENASTFPLFALQSFFPVGEMEIAVKYDKSGYNDEDVFSDPKPVVLEVALWQNPVRLAAGYDGTACPRLSRQLSNDLGTVVEGFEKDFRLTDASSLVTGQTDQSPRSLSAIGVKCESTFRTGTATIDGASGTYASFSHEPADSLVSATPVPAPTAIPRIFRSEVSAALSLTEMHMTRAFQDVLAALPVEWDSGSNMDLNPMAYIASNASWLPNIYKSVDSYARTPLYCVGEDPALVSGWQQLQLINSTQLLTSLVRTFKAYAIEMAKPSASSEAISDTLNLVKSTSIISPGRVPPVVVLILLALWALGSSTLGLVFGARPRWSETLDGFSMFRFGSDHPGFAVNEGAQFHHHSECQRLRELPGRVGVSPQTGHVTLLRRQTGHGRG